MRRRARFVSLLALGLLAACQNVGDMIASRPVAPPQEAPPPPDSGLKAVNPASPAPPASPPAASVATKPAAPTQPAAIPGTMRLQIAPLVGASVESAAPLTERLNLKARERGITLVGSTDTSATHILKGYFSVITEGPDTTVVYVWDLYDPSGNRLHRINGQQKAPSIKGAEGWAAVAPATMQAVADATIEQLAAWLSGNAG